MILSIETATSTCSVALHKEGKLLASYALHLDKSHSGSLTMMIDEVLQRTNHKTTDLQAVAISKGPGSYTGLRIGTATAKGLCFALNIPLIAVNTLKAMALNVIANSPKIKGVSLLFLPMIDARRMEVYTAIFDEDLKEIKEVNAKIIEENTFEKFLSKHQLVLFGDGAAKCKAILSHQNYLYLDQIAPSAKYIGELASVKFKKQEFEDLAYFEPYYLKDFMVKTPTKNKSLV